MKVSLVRNATETATMHCNATTVLKTIRTGGRNLKAQIEKIRWRYKFSLELTGDSAKAKRAIDSSKKSLPAVTWSGKFSERAGDKIIEHSGLLCADLDSLNGRLEEVKSQLKQSPHLWATFVSPSGDGLKAVFRVRADATQRIGSFRAVENHVLELTGRQIDQSGKDVARLCFLSWDPGLYHNPNATELAPLPLTEKPKFVSGGAVNLSERQRIASELLGNIEWVSETSGFCVCPGKHLHTTADGARDCKIELDNVPTLHCFHNSCHGILDGINHELRSRIGKAESDKPVGIEVRLGPPEYYFDAGRNLYWIKNSRNAWLPLNETQFKRVLRQQGVSPRTPESSHVSPLDEALLDVQRHKDIHYAGPLAGFHAGVYKMGERRVLVTESPRIIEPLDGQWQTLESFLINLLRDPDFDQTPYLFGWLKVGYEALRAGERRPGQGLAIIGVHDCGKSLLQNFITLILGGRSAKPYQFMSGLTPFNSDLFEAEHLMIEDEQASTDIRARRNFGAQLKQITVVDWQRCHAKNRVAISLTPFWRLSVSVNNEAENLMVLPPIDDSIEDKLIILRANKNLMPMPTTTLEQRKLFWNALESELPAFLHFLHSWQIPSELSSERFGIKHFHHPEILEALDALAPERRLLNLIDEELFKYEDDQWQGTAEQLERVLTSEESNCRFEARRLFTFNTACGVYLARLARKHPTRFVKARVGNLREWTINA